MIVSDGELEALIEKVRHEVAEPAAGIYGPRAVGWRINREAILFLGAGRAALLQLAHPFVAHAIDGFSQTRVDPLGRFQRTFEHVYRICFDELDRAVESSRRVMRVHRRIVGTLTESGGNYRAGASYAAAEESALLWVFATLIETSVMIYELAVQPLSADEKESYYRESRFFAYLFGVSDRVLPPDWPAFKAYCEATAAGPDLFVTNRAKEIARFLLTAPRPLFEPIADSYRRITAALLPEAVRHGYDYGELAAPDWVLARAVPSMSPAYRALPDAVRYVPAFLDARARLGGPKSSGRLARQLGRLNLMTMVTEAARMRGPTRTRAGQRNTAVAPPTD